MLYPRPTATTKRGIEIPMASSTTRRCLLCEDQLPTVNKPKPLRCRPAVAFSNIIFTYKDEHGADKYSVAVGRHEAVKCGHQCFLDEGAEGCERARDLGRDGRKVVSEDAQRRYKDNKNERAREKRRRL